MRVSNVLPVVTVIRFPLSSLPRCDKLIPFSPLCYKFFMNLSHRRVPTTRGFHQMNRKGAL